GERNQAGDVFGRDVDIAHARLGGGAAVAGRHEHFGNLGGLRALPRQRVLATAAAYDQDLHEAGVCACQCRKCRMPVNAMVIPCSSAAAMTSSSRLLPPGCTMALMPYPAAASMPSRKGKNASDAMALPSTCSPSSLALRAATCDEYTR